MAGVSTDELKGRVSIVDLVGDYVSLRKAGKSHTGLCPFHDDKNPSFHVNEEKGMFYCFSCKAGGDIFNFLQRIKGCSFKEALYEVAEKAGVKIDLRSSGLKAANEALLTINKAVCGFFRKSLNNGSSESRQALSYLKQRGITPEIAEHFSIGYAPVSGAAVPRFLSKGGFSLKRAAELGIISAAPEPFCKFRARIIFPIFSPDSEVVGFGGRILAQTRDAPKYLNSSESAVYKKRQSLYGLNRTRDEIRKQGTAVLVEGYTDLLSVYSSGVKNVAASLGTSLTRHQVGVLRRYSEDIVILYDGDRAGMDSSFTAGEVFMAVGIVPRVARIPEGLDPDQFAKQKGPDALRSLIDKAQPLTEVLMDDIARSISEKKISQAVAAGRLMGIVPILGDSPEIGPYVRDVSRRFGFRESDLYSIVPSSGKARFSISEPQTAKEPECGPAEMMLLRIALKFPDIADLLSGEEVIRHIPDGEVREIISSILSSGAAASSPGASGLLSRAHFTLDAIDFIDRENVAVEVEKCLVKLKLDSMGDELKLLRERLRVDEGGESGDENSLMKRYRDLLEQRKLIRRDLS